MLSCAEASQVGSALWPAWIAAASGVLGVLASSVVMLWLKALDRRDSDIARLRSAFADWHAALQRISTREHKAILLHRAAASAHARGDAEQEALFSHDMRALAHEISELQAVETAALANLMFLDFGSDEARKAAAISNIKPGARVGELAMRYDLPPSEEDYLLLEKRQATELGELARDLNLRLRAARRRWFGSGLD